ncbi:MAG: chlorophyll synthase ChlG [Alphaproteobacteria bacterium]|nr:MAG: chlorophyll synthase ChlG [Alphaproteobacteria bacterium]PZO37944.1 MAG: chlorophyll synthase ChlG [Alphaproteobacteria bacterium]
MDRTLVIAPVSRLPSPAAVLALFKPITWFPPMWAFMCGVVSSGVSFEGRWLFLIAGIALTGPLVCATSQAVNDWFDRHVDAINEPDRPIPSGRIPGRWGLGIAIVWTGLSVVVAAFTGPWVLGATLLGLALAWAYSAPPLRLKMSGVAGPSAVALSYEGLTWFTGAAVMAGTLPGAPVLILAVLYSFGAYGIMVLNDFKAVEGDRLMGVRSLPAELGIAPAAWIACAVMAAPQFLVVALLFVAWDRPWHGAVVAALLIAQALLMKRLLVDPKRLTPWYNGTGTTLYVLGMLVSAFAVGSLSGAGI